MAEMDMKEKLVELLGADVCKHDSCDNCECQGSTDMCIATLKAYMADHLIQNGVTFATDNNVGSKWISVKDRLPETELVRYRDEVEPSGYGEYYASEMVLVFATNHKIYLAEYGESNESNWWDSDAGLYEDVTHWMPLPEPPKEVEE